MRHCTHCGKRLWPWSEKFFDRSPPQDFFCSHFCLESFREQQKHAQTFEEEFNKRRSLYEKLCEEVREIEKEGNQNVN